MTDKPASLTETPIERELAVDEFPEKEDEA